MFCTVQKFVGRSAVSRKASSQSELPLQLKTKPFPRLCDRDRKCDVAFCIGISQHMNEPSISLQEENHFLNEKFGRITACERKLQLC
jgi:hypothetical protein